MAAHATDLRTPVIDGLMGLRDAGPQTCIPGLQGRHGSRCATVGTPLVLLVCTEYSKQLCFNENFRSFRKHNKASLSKV